MSKTKPAPVQAKTGKPTPAKGQPAKSTATAVSKVKEAALPSTEVDWGQDSGSGMENVTSADLLIPRLTILQGLSPQLNKNKAEFIKGAESGDIVDVSSGELFKDPILFLPVYYRKDYIEWAPRDSGKGLIRIHSTPEILESCRFDEETRRHFTREGNYVAETAQYYGFNLSTDDLRQCFIPMASSQLRASKQWNTLARNQRVDTPKGKVVPAFWYRTYRLSTVARTNAKGDWNGWGIEADMTLLEYAEETGNPARDLFNNAKSFRDALVAGEVRGNLAPDEAEATVGSNDEGDM